MLVLNQRPKPRLLSSHSDQHYALKQNVYGERRINHHERAVITRSRLKRSSGAHAVIIRHRLSSQNRNTKKAQIKNWTRTHLLRRRVSFCDCLDRRILHPYFFNLFHCVMVARLRSVESRRILLCLRRALLDWIVTVMIEVLHCGTKMEMPILDCWTVRCWRWRIAVVVRRGVSSMVKSGARALRPESRMLRSCVLRWRWRLEGLQFVLACYFRYAQCFFSKYLASLLSIFSSIMRLMWLHLQRVVASASVSSNLFLSFSVCIVDIAVSLLRRHFNVVPV